MTPPISSNPPVTTLRDYRVHTLCGRIDPVMAREVIDFWRHGRLVAAEEALRRVPEVLCVVRDAQGVLVGLNSAYRAVDPGTLRVYYYYRTFIRDADRGVSGLPTLMLSLAKACLRERASIDGATGMRLVMENPKLMHPAIDKRLRKAGFRSLGKDARGCAVWQLGFDEESESPAG